MHLITAQLAEQKMLEECETLPLACSACGWQCEWKVRSREDVHAFLDVRRLRQFQHEFFLLQRTQALFDRFPDSLHPEKVDKLRIPMTDGSCGHPDPEFEVALRQDTELFDFLSRSSFILPARFKFIAEMVDVYQKEMQILPQVYCPSCGKPTVEIETSIVRERRRALSDAIE